MSIFGIFGILRYRVFNEIIAFFHPCPLMKLIKATSLLKIKIIEAN